MTYKQSVAKQKLEYTLLFPLFFLGKMASIFIKPPVQTNYFLFFPCADIGGSVKVNAEITALIQDKQPLIIFSKRPKNNQFLPHFQLKDVSHLDISRWVDHKAYHFINVFFRGLIAGWINRSKYPVVFGGESIYFYKIIPHVKKACRIIELCHMNTWINYSQAFISRIDARIFSTQKIKRDVERQYLLNKIPEEYQRRLFFCDNKIDIPEYSQPINDIFQILFVGRGAPQKRVHLIVTIAKALDKLKAPVHFSFVGDVESYFDEEARSICTLNGKVSDRKKLEKIYDQSDALILTSAYEGLPLVVMDMMARGRIVISTAVDSIPDYITHLENGLLIENRNEDQIITDATAIISSLASNREQQQLISEHAYTFAKSHFSAAVFDEFYRKMLVKPI